MVQRKFDRRALLLGLGLSPLAGCAVPLGPGVPRNLHAATLNIWHDAGGNWPARLDLIVTALQALNADVIALQEVLEDSRKDLPNQAFTIASALGFSEVHFVATEPEGAAKRYGNAILTRYPVVEVARRHLEPRADSRSAIRVRVRTDSGPVDIVATHLAWQANAGAVRARQVADLLQWLPDDNVPILLMGDFNAPLGDPGLAALRPPRFAAADLHDGAVTTLNPANGHKPRVIDHIFFDTSAFALEDVHLFADKPANGVYPSDHFGVAARLAWR